MMGGMGAGMFWSVLLFCVLLSGFAYIIWVLASKESDSVKLVGQIIALIIAIIAVVTLLYGGVYGGLMGRGGMCKMGGKGMMGGGMMNGAAKMSKADMQKHIEKMMKNPEMKKMMEGCLKTVK